MSIEALPVTSIINDTLESVEEQEIQFPTEAEVVANLVQLQGRKETLSVGLTALAAQTNVMPTDRLRVTRVTMTEEYFELTNTIQALKDAYRDVVTASESIEERRVRLHNESKHVIELLHELQTRHATLTMGMIALTTKTNHTRDILSNERNELSSTIIKLREEQRGIVETITACNQTVTRPQENNEHDPDYEARKAERRRIEQPYVIQIHNNGEDPTHNDNLPEHLTGLNYRYLTNTAL